MVNIILIVDKREAVVIRIPALAAHANKFSIFSYGAGYIIDHILLFALLI